MSTQYEHVTGLADLQKMLDGLPARIEANVLRGGLRAGANVIRDEAKAQVPVESGATRDSVRVSTRVKHGEVTVSVKAGNKKAWYAHLIEFGAARHWIKPKNRKSLFFAGLAKEAVNHPGAKPNPFMRRALDTQWRAAIAAAADYMRNRLPRELKKSGK